MKSLTLWLFLLGCIGSRSLFTLASYMASTRLLFWLGILALGPVIGWFYIIFIGSRDTGAEVFGGTIWWKNLRPIHMLLWAFFAYLAITGNHMAYIVVGIDTLFGLGSFFLHHFKK